MTLTHGELFAGIAGFGLGFDRAGMETLWHVEKDEKCKAVLRMHYPDAIILSDVKDAGKSNLPRVDVISFGSPCQDLSVAGKRKGLIHGKQSNLFFEAVRIVDELKPAFAVWENVPGAFSSNSGRDYAAVLSAFRELGARDIAWRVLDSQYFGVPQRRRRIFLVADFGGERAAEVLFESESGSGNPTARGKVGKDTAYSLRANPSHSGDKGDGGINTTLVVNAVINLANSGANQNNVKETDIADTMDTWGTQAVIFQQNTRDEVRLMSGDGQVAGALAAQPGMKQQNFVAFDANQNGMDVSENIAPTMRHGRDGRKGHSSYPKISVMAHGQANAEIIEDGSPSLMANHEAPILWEMSHASEAVREHGAVSPTLQSRMGTGGNQVPMYGIRRLTPVECSRLQGFPDDWNAYGIDGHGKIVVLADAHRYRQLGNAVTVNVAEWIGRRIMKVS